MKKITLFVAFVLFLFVGVHSSFACKCMMQTAQESYKQADKVYVGKVKSVTTQGTTNTVTIEVLEQFKGETKNVTLQTAESTAACGISFQEDENYIIYETEDGKVNSCGGTKTLTSGIKELHDLKKQRKRYFVDQYEDFLKDESSLCRVARDHCNTYIFKGGKRYGITNYRECPTIDLTYSCTERNYEPYTKKDIFERFEGKTCKVATDGCNTLNLKDGKVVSQTEKYCENHTPIYECREQISEEPRMCTMQYDPVCGVDGKTYGNSCQAGDVEIAYEGECENSGLSSGEKAKLEKLEAKIATKYVTIIDKWIKKYENRLAIHSNPTIIENIHNRIMKKVVEKKKIVQKNSRIYTLLEYLELRLKRVGHDFQI